MMLENIEPLSDAQLREGERAFNQFRNFEQGVVITTPDLAHALAIKTLEGVDAGIDLFVSEINFNDPRSVDAFLSFWRENQKLLKDLPYGVINPKKFRTKFGHEMYPLFLCINPIALDVDDEAIRMLHTISKHGKVNLAITPDVLEHTGALWPNVPTTYHTAVLQPDDRKNKRVLVEYLCSRSGIKELGLQWKVEDPNYILTPTDAALQRLI